MFHRRSRPRFSVLLVCVGLLAFASIGCQSSPDETDPAPAGEAREQPETSEPAPRHEQVEQRRADRESGDDEQMAQLADQISDEDLEMFARGVRAIAERERQLEEEGRDLETLEQEAGSPVEMREAEEQVRQEMEDALAEVGLRFPDFLQMGQVVRQSPELRERLGEHLEDDELEEFFGEE